MIPGNVVAEDPRNNTDFAVGDPDVSAEDVENFGRLPCRYNGRLTTFAAYAKNELRDISDRDFTEDDTGERVAGVRWLLNVATAEDNEDDSRLISVSRLVRREFDLQARKSNLFGRSWYSFSELPIETFQQRLKDASDVPTDERTVVDRELFDIARRLRRWNVVRASFAKVLQPGLSSKEIIARIEIIEAESMPRPVPTGNGTPWTPFVRASVAHQLLPNDATPPAAAFFEVLAAYEADDGPRFRKAISTYRELLQKHDHAKAPFGYTVPKGWLEIGRPYALKPTFYTDAMTSGLRVTSLEIRRGDELVGLDVNIFDGEFPPARRFVNDWRIDHGLTPLPSDQAARLLRPVRVGGFEGHLLDVRTPDGAPQERTRSLGAVLGRGRLTFLVTFNGPLALVDANEKAFDDFVRSLEWGSEESLKKWFGKIEPVSPELVGPYTGLVAVVPDGDDVWVCEMIDTSEVAAKRREEFLAVVDSLRIVSDAPPAARLEFDVPETWTRQEHESTFATYYTTDPDSALPVSVVSFVWMKRSEGDDLPRPYVNHWIESYGGRPVDADRLAERTSSRRVRGRKVTLVEFEIEGPSEPSDSP